MLSALIFLGGVINALPYNYHHTNVIYKPISVLIRFLVDNSLACVHETMTVDLNRYRQRVVQYAHKL